MKWNPGKHYEMQGVWLCSSLTLTAAGEVVVWVKKQSDTYEARWYDQQGKLIHTLPPPPECRHELHRVLAVEVGGKQQVALSCYKCQCIWLGSRDSGAVGKLLKKLTGAWIVAWQASGEEGSEEREGQPKPGTMCQGKPGQIVAANWREEESVSVFDITQIPFRVEVPEMKLGMKAEYLCYCDLPGVGGALAVSNGCFGYKVCMFSLDSGKLLWGVGGRDERGQRVKVAGAEWYPQRVCSDSRGRLYVANWDKHKIIVLSAASGSVIQEIKHPHLEHPRYLCWHEQRKSIVVGNGKISYFQIAF